MHLPAFHVVEQQIVSVRILMDDIVIQKGA